MRFTFVQEDTGVEGEPDALILHGTSAARFGLMLQADEAGVRWLSELGPDEV